jgi:hypothetical protein
MMLIAPKIIPTIMFFPKLPTNILLYNLYFGAMHLFPFFFRAPACRSQYQRERKPDARDNKHDASADKGKKSQNADPDV